MLFLFDNDTLYRQLLFTVKEQVLKLRPLLTHYSFLTNQTKNWACILFNRPLYSMLVKNVFVKYTLNCLEVNGQQTELEL